MTWHPDIPEHYRNQIVTGDARELAKAIPDESIDLIFTDPVYDRIEDYEWLAETAARVLRPDSACLVFGGIGWVPGTVAALSKHLTYKWTFGGRIQSAASYGFVGKLIPKYKIGFWYEKGKSPMYSYVFDMLNMSMAHSKIPEINNHKWGKHPELIWRWLLAVSQVGAVVFDPFVGGGTTSAISKMLQRNYIAFEIDPATAELARERVRNTQPPLLVPQAEQGALNL